MEKTQKHIEYDKRRATLALDSSVSTVPLVSSSRARALAKLHIFTVRDLVLHFPFRYIDLTHISTIAQARPSFAYTIKGLIHEVNSKRIKRGSMTRITLVDDTGTLIITCFNQPWLEKKLKEGMILAVSGEVEFNYGYKRMTNPLLELMENLQDKIKGEIIPIHHLTSGIKAGLMRRLVSNALDKVFGTIDPLPLHLKTRYRLMSRSESYSSMHFPVSMEMRNEARRRIAYEEVLLLHIALRLYDVELYRKGQPFSHIIDGSYMKALNENLPFSLTDDQVTARNELLSKMKEEVPAHHMIIGDVGSGKTIVSSFAVASAADSTSQTLFMAPTEILASQHAKVLGSLFDKIGISWSLLTSSTPQDERKKIISDLAAGTLKVLFGTHALLEHDIQPKMCSLVIIDEQQRFGVEQRNALIKKGKCPDVVSLTATPIPRSLALALFGNCSLSYIRSTPFVSTQRITHLHLSSNKSSAYDAARQACDRGEQAFIICPLIYDNSSKNKNAKSEEDDVYEFASIAIEDEGDMDHLDVAGVEKQTAFLKTSVFPEYRVEALHGRLASTDKARIIEQFRRGDIDILVATSIVEVGVDVPNATVMIIENADRFGLSQLHQLRGRVGRGTKSAEVHLISYTKNEKALSRLRYMEEVDDGFSIAEFDLKQRREGDILGNRQHGASLLKTVNIVKDKNIIETAYRDAKAIIDEDPLLETDEYIFLGKEARRIYGESLSKEKGTL